MTLKTAYDELMDRVEVTPEMRGRILRNLRSAASAPSARTVSFPAVRRYLSLAACFALLLAGAVFLPRLLARTEPDPPVLAAPDMVEAASARELSGLVGFDVAEPSGLPFTVEETAYTACWGELAQITCTGEGQSLTFRQSLGGEDNSGDYTAYGDVLERTENGTAVTLKGGGGAYSLVLWRSGDYTCSLRFDPGVPEDVCMDICGRLQRDLTS